MEPNSSFYKVFQDLKAEGEVLNVTLFSCCTVFQRVGTNFKMVILNSLVLPAAYSGDTRIISKLHTCWSPTRVVLSVALLKLAVRGEH